MRTLELLIAYDGTDYVGWQRQPEGTSIQGLLEDALAPIEGRPVAVVGAGRTDAGVHASGQVAGVRLTSPIGCDDLTRALNARLPAQVRVLATKEAPASFHARFDARTKTYEYRIANGPIVSPFVHRYVWQVPGTLDVEAMQAAARLVEGQHDFACFQSTGSSVQTTVRRILTSELNVDAEGLGPGVPAAGPTAGRLLVYRVKGDGFLRHMVRAIVGTLVEVGRGAMDVSQMGSLLEGRSRAEAGPTAPAQGLCLVAVAYDEPPPRLLHHGKTL